MQDCSRVDSPPQAFFTPFTSSFRISSTTAGKGRDPRLEITTRSGLFNSTGEDEAATRLSFRHVLQMDKMQMKMNHRGIIKRLNAPQ
jgi:hypothetical protein